MARLKQVTAQGASREIGRAMGRFGTDAFQRLIRSTPAWGDIAELARGPRVAAMIRTTRAALPELAEEVAGLAEGLGCRTEEAFALVAAGDLRADGPGGCTTVLRPGTPIVIGHNEDGDPAEMEVCGLLICRPEGAPAFNAFLYPASMPGGAFGVNDAGLVVTVNNIRARQSGDCVPRQIVGRAMMGCRTLDEAVGLIETLPRAGAFHFAMAQAGDPRLLSVEFTGERVSVAALDAPMAHANHLVHPGMASLPQIVTRSSADRQARAEALLPTNPLAILGDASGPGLPILRTDPADPDQENTIVTLIATIDARRVTAAIHHPGIADPFVTLTAEDGELSLT